MKISKLFHWLYAFVMFLPILAVGSTVLISTFNMSSKEQTEITYKYETNEVNSNEDLIIGNIYHFKNYYIGSQSTSNLVMSGVVFNIQTDFGFYLDDSAYSFNNILNYSSIYISDDSMFLYSPSDYNADNYIAGFSIDDALDYGTIECDIVLQEFRSIDDTELMSNLYQDFSISSYNEIESVETHNLNAREVFYDSLDELKESPYFSWAYNSFLSTPISYIVGLFSMPTNHVIVELLSYWLAISIIWLVFDLIMYVPLLVHRWLDKGVLE